MSTQLSDDGTMDTVLRCSECGEEFRYNFSQEDCADNPSGGTYEDFVETSIDDATESHECASTGHTSINADNYFDAAQALYWYCNSYHEGQDSELYSIMSARLKYSPGASERGVDPESVEAPTFHRELVGGGWDATEMLAAIEAAQDCANCEGAGCNNCDHSDPAA